MKHILTSALILFSQYTFSQDKFEINSNSAWKIDKLINVISQRGNRSNGDESFKLFVAGDTTILSQTYFKIYKTGILFLETPQEYSHLYVGALRQINSKVYFIEKGKNAEELLYDYTLKVNDIIQGKIGKGKTVLKVVTLEDGRKRFYISKSMLHAMDAYITEGIGSSGGLLFEPPVGHYMYNDHYLICYTEKDSIIQDENDPLQCGCLTKPSRFPLNIQGEWNVQYVPSYDDYAYTGIKEYYHYYFSNDTFINKKKYLKLYKSGVAYYDEPFYYENIYSGAIMDDDNKIYFVDKDKTQEELLIDYSLNIGDTIKAKVGFNYKISEIIELDGGRRMFETTSDLSGLCVPIPELIEGIGHTGGLIEGPPCFHPGYMVHKLSCYVVRDSIIYNNPRAKDKACGTDTKIPENKTPDFEIFPNPFTNQLHINSNQGIESISIYKIDGRLLHIYEHLKMEYNEYNINTTNLNQGIYIIGVQYKNAGIIYKKMVKNKF